jgi:antitoxin component of MazEF toxin-antitoxin module
MKSVRLKVTRVGNSHYVLLPERMFTRYRIKDTVSAELLPEGILLKREKSERLSWEESAKAMAAERCREFVDFEKATVADGLHNLAKTCAVSVGVYCSP